MGQLYRESYIAYSICLTGTTGRDIDGIGTTNAAARNKPPSCTKRVTVVASTTEVSTNLFAVTWKTKTRKSE